MTSAEEAVFAAIRARNLIASLQQICDKRGVTIREICGRNRTLGVARARQELWWLIRNHPERRYSYLEIARMFGRDHTTIRQGVQAHQRRLPP